MQSDQQPKKRKEDEDEDRAGFFFFPFFRGRRVEMIPPLLLMALFLLLALFWLEKPAPQEPAPQTVAATAPETVKVETQRWGSSTIFPIEGKDSAGKRAAFDVAVLPKELSWVSKSSTQLSQGSEVIPDDQLTTRLFSQEL